MTHRGGRSRGRKQLVRIGSSIGTVIVVVLLAAVTAAASTTARAQANATQAARTQPGPASASTTRASTRIRRPIGLPPHMHEQRERIRSATSCLPRGQPRQRHVSARLPRARSSRTTKEPRTPRGRAPERASISRSQARRPDTVQPGFDSRDDQGDAEASASRKRRSPARPRTTTRSR